MCSLNVHKRCQKNVANNCGINTKQMAEILSEMGISPDKTPRRTKYTNQSGSGSSSDGALMEGGSASGGDNGNETAEDISIRLAAQKMIEEKMQEASNAGKLIRIVLYKLLLNP